MKRLALIGILALVVIGCVVAAGCTSTSTTSTTPATTTSTTTTDAVVGIWTLPNGTTVVFGEDFNGVMTTGENETNFTWKKTTDGKYQVDNEKGEQVIWTLDNVKGTMTNAAGMVLTKQASDTSGNALTSGPKLNQVSLILDKNGGDSDGKGCVFGSQVSISTSASKRNDDGIPYECLGYYDARSGGHKILEANGDVVSGTVSPYVKDGKWNYKNTSNKTFDTVTLYAHWGELMPVPDIIKNE